MIEEIKPQKSYKKILIERLLLMFSTLFIYLSFWGGIIDIDNWKAILAIDSILLLFMLVYIITKFTKIYPILKYGKLNNIVKITIFIVFLFITIFLSTGLIYTLKDLRNGIHVFRGNCNQYKLQEPYNSIGNTKILIYKPTQYLKLKLNNILVIQKDTTAEKISYSNCRTTIKVYYLENLKQALKAEIIEE
ncbi:hypothetical protein GF362_02000 [Candidatus Dojkabacteria bacterium]|nr:hypothetical protein [Candidatus Dojkabacteria bacterium]